MRPVFRQAHAETLEDFLVLVTGWKIVFSYVYEDPGDDNDLEFDLPAPEPGERHIAFNLARHGEDARRRFCEASALERRLGDPDLRPLPHWLSFVVGMGPYSHAYSIDDARRMVEAARREMRILWKAFEKH